MRVVFILVLVLAGFGLSTLTQPRRDARVAVVKKTVAFWGYLLKNRNADQKEIPRGDVYSGVTLPKWEQRILGEVSEIHGLTDDERLMLYVIRKIEDGRPGKELGVLCEGAMVFEDGNKSFWVQSHYAAFLIRKYYRGNLREFQEIYCPVGVANDPQGLNKYWYPRAYKFRNRWKGYFEASNKSGIDDNR